MWRNGAAPSKSARSAATSASRKSDSFRIGASLSKTGRFGFFSADPDADPFDLPVGRTFPFFDDSMAHAHAGEGGASK